MRLAKIKISYSDDIPPAHRAEFEAAKFDLFRQPHERTLVWKGDPKDPANPDGEKEEYNSAAFAPIVVDLDKLVTATGYEVVERPIPDGAPDFATLELRPNPVVNQKVNVVVPGLALLSMERATVIYDACTDELNVFMKDGWRILAICPQPDQRRPDYVLGRSGPKGETE